MERFVNIALWIVQALLALVFVGSGAMKFVMSVEEMTKQMPMPGWFLHFIGLAEILGGIGVILPWMTGIKPRLTPLAAACLVVIMIGAVAVTAMSPDPAMAVIPAVVGALAAFVAWGRGLRKAT